MSDTTTPMSPLSAARSPAALTLFLAAFALLLGADLWLKWWSFERWVSPPVDIAAAVARVEPLPPDTATIVPGVLNLKLTLNTGAVFGMWSGRRLVFIGATVLAIGVVGYFFATSRRGQWVLHLALAMVLAGALGNLYDRVTYHAVRDMLWLFPDVKLPFGWAWPGGSSDVYPWIFNLADVYLLAGIATILLRSTKAPQAAQGPAVVDGPPGG